MSQAARPAARGHDGGTAVGPGARSALRAALGAALGAVLVLGPVAAYVARYASGPTVVVDRRAEMAASGPALYADRPVAAVGETIRLHARSAVPYRLVVRTDAGDTLWRSAPLPPATPATSADAWRDGARWPSVAAFRVPDTLAAPMYLRIGIDGVNAYEAENAGAEAVVAVGPADRGAPVLVVVPATTWAAYNVWGGASVYRSAAPRDVYRVAFGRPSTTFTHGDRDARIEANAVSWLRRHGPADLVADHDLHHNHPALATARVVVLLVHTEYATAALMDALRAHRRRGGGLLALGGNQLYWRTRIHRDARGRPAALEVRKDLTPFSRPYAWGGLWRQGLVFEEQLLGVRYDRRGIGTYAPYRVETPDHWLFEGTGVSRGDLFGLRGLDARPISGDETDKATWRSPRLTLLARGLNPLDGPSGAVYDGSSSWDGRGGGEMTVVETDEDGAVLATGSIQSAAGLGVDPVFTRVVSNFLARHAR